MEIKYADHRTGVHIWSHWFMAGLFILKEIAFQVIIYTTGVKKE